MYKKWGNVYMTTQTFNSPIFTTAPAHSPRLSLNSHHPFAPLSPPSFHIRNNVRIINHYHITIAPQAGLAAQQHIANLAALQDESCWDKLMKCLRR